MRAAVVHAFDPLTSPTSDVLTICLNVVGTFIHSPLTLLVDCAQFTVVTFAFTKHTRYQIELFYNRSELHELTIANSHVTRYTP
jgi:hypothetical protein